MMLQYLYDLVMIRIENLFFWCYHCDVM